ncbi:DNA-methyltransferase [Pseudomonas aeruginosa]|uniref:DNA-methyltransferase n=1 Tax=Pseudomonas aeruginosa TaxID=287 RepID=UPI003D345156
MPDQSFHCCITSPPYFGLRDYGMASQIGLEQTPDEFVSRLVEVFREVRRVLRDDGTLWLNLGDSYANDGKWGGSSGGKHANALHGNTSVGRTKTRTGLKPKDLIGIPWRVAFALQVDGWFLRQDIIWHKPNPMPESVRDRCTKAHEYVFMLTKSPRYYYDHEAVKEDAVSEHPSGNGFKRDARESYKNLDGTARGNDEQWTGVGGKRNRRSVWTVPTAGFKGAHFATFPPDLIRPCVLAGAPRGGLVLDPFGGAGTTALVAMQEGRRSVLIELNPEYAAIARNRLDTAWLEGAAQLDLLHDQKESVA